MTKPQQRNPLPSARWFELLLHHIAVLESSFESAQAVLQSVWVLQTRTYQLQRWLKKRIESLASLEERCNWNGVSPFCNV